MNKELFLCLALLGATVLLPPQAALAHASPEAEDPKVGSTVASPPQQVSIRFDAPIEALFSRLEPVRTRRKQPWIGALHH